MTTLSTHVSSDILRLLIVDDNPTDRAIYTRWIQRAALVSLTIQEAETGIEALESCKTIQPHCILLDYQLPDMTGLDFLEELRQFNLQTEAPIIFLTGQGNELVAAQAIKLGAQDYFVKNTLSEEYLWHHIEQAIYHFTTKRRIRTLEKQSHIILQSSEDGLVVVGADGRIRYTNLAAEQLLQQAGVELVGIPFGYPMVQGKSKEIKIQHQDTSTTPVEMRVVAIEWEDQPAYLASLRDLTERREAEAERQRHEAERQYAQKQESLGVLAAGIAHDFNNLLMSIVARAGLALRSLPSDSPTRTHLDIIEQSGLRGGELANQMLTFAGKTKLDFQTMAFSKFLKEIKPFLRLTVSKQITLTFDLQDDVPPIRGDESQLRQLLINTVTNAAEAIGEQEGTVQISTNTIDTSTQDLRHYHIMGDLPWGQCVSLTIQDTGRGMKPEIIPKIFEPFFSTKFPGRGLGLAAVLGIVRAHGAALAIHSRPEVSTEFLFLFPITKKSIAPTSPSLTLPKKSLKTSIASKVLIVDDEEEVRTACSLILQEIGFDPLVAQDGKAGAHLFDQHHEQIALVFLDLTMPHVDGGTLAAEIRQKSQTVPILLASGYAEHEVMKRFTHSRINAFIQKPFQIEVLIAKVQELVGRDVEKVQS